MKELYDAKIRRLTEMLQDAGVSPTEVENNLAVVAEETEETLPLFDQLSLTSDGLAAAEGLIHATQEDGEVEDDGPMSEEAFEEYSASSIGLERDNNEDDDDREEDDDLLFMSSSGSLSLLSSCTTQLTRPDLSQQTSGAIFHADTISPMISTAGTTTNSTAILVTKPTNPNTVTPTGRRASVSHTPRPFPPSKGTSNTSHLYLQQTPQPQLPQPLPQNLIHEQERTQEQQDPDQSRVSPSKASSRASIDEVKAQTERQGSGHEHEPSQEAVTGRTGGGPTHDTQKRPIPSFVAESFAAGTMGIKTLREKWAIASGVLSWNKPKSLDQFTTAHNNSSTSSIISSPSGLFVRNEGIINDKKPPLVETSIPSTSPLDIKDEISPLGDRKELEKERNQDIWNSIIPPKASRKHPKKTHRHYPSRPMSDVGLLGSLVTYPATTMARDIPRPPISRIHDYLQRPDSYSPSPLHYRAISMAAALIDTGAITPAKLYARRTQTMIAKWTLGLIMNSKQSRTSHSSFPVIRESLSPEHEELLLDNQEDSDRNDGDSLHQSEQDTGSLEMMVPSSYDRPDAIDRTQLPKALSFRSHSTSSNLLSSSYPRSPSLHYYMQRSMSTHQSVVELSDISSSPRPMSPASISSISGTDSGSGTGSKPLTDRYGFLVQARPMAIQQGKMKFNETYAADGMESPTSARTTHNNKISGKGDNPSSKHSTTSSEESEHYTSSPPSVSSFYFGQSSHGNGILSAAGAAGTTAAVGGMVSASGNVTTSATALPTSVTSPVLSTSTRPMSTLSPPTSSSATITTLLSQIKVLHDTVQMTQNEKWDAFLKKRRRRVHQGETNGGALANMSSSNLNLTSPLFGSLIMSSIEDQIVDQEDDQSIYWASVCIVGIATMGKGSDWEEFRDLTRGGIPVVYRNKIWQEASGAYDIRQPGYYKGLLSRQDLEACQCWGDIELDLHRTFPTNILFGPGGHGIDKLKNVLIAYSLHNPSVGYCQGMNLLAGTLLLTNNSEEEAFWILTAMLGRHLPEDYFTQQLLSPQADQRVLRELVQEIMPRLSQHFQEMHVDLTAVTFSWFLTLFTDCLPVETLLRVWDVFFVEGMLIVFKIAVAILWMNEKEILKCRNGAAVYCFMKQMTMGMHQADKLMKVAFVTLKSYIHPEKIEARRQHHQRSVRQEMIQEQQQRKMRTFACASPPQRPTSPAAK
ncbi:hypothetical protein BGX28_005349 [Mortierella sp. GBA30]|nr:hypothetical protein BGX28_005349 [Mortierella sp. GBA30]